ncbi:L-2-hydroxyglutarate oxidase [Jidongwangia harbinensis]|uniref:L-2-hydroxyglutarate oxidase n=1 Tax=Jidongwangia harbinensis TaxID=2878561 RepID=UPI001CD9931D|nr:L-2-hydroxyglutarate oxidase [Jidongwangia harbinensis]MCA2214321.1 L-2-hydroxyglutarate oxidase [Jidongwangia harbinensis]
MPAGPPRIGVIGAGIIGLAVARRLSGHAEVTVLDKEDRVGAHQTGHNSGVAHAGLYYPPGSLKAALCRRGVTLLRAYCTERDLPYVTCGKVVVARDGTEADRLAEIERRARANGVPDLRRLDADRLRDVEPHTRGVAALHSPRTAIVDFGAVARAFAGDLRAGALRLGFPVAAIRRGPRSAVVRSAADEELEFDTVIVCAGLHSDRVSRLAGDSPGPAIVPFRGEYHRLVANRTHLVRGLIYPVPDPRYPFLGVHLTRRVDGTVDVGPNAVLALAREGYRWGTVAPGDLWQTLRWPGFRRMARTHWRTGVRELHGSLSRRAFVAAARRYVPELTVADVEPAGAGVRAQAVDADGTLVDDFRIHRLGPVVTVRNAPSPAATSSLAIADHLADQLADRL